MNAPRDDGGPPLAALRAEVREFLHAELAARPGWSPADSWQGFDAAFSESLGRRGWIGMTWPREYGGHGRSALERYTVQEELLAVGAPVGAHWVAERQSGPLLLRLGTEAQKQRWLPRIAAGKAVFCIGMSEPDAGSDLAALRTRATRTANGWRLDGRKVWTTHAARSDAMIALVRTAPVDAARRHAGLSQFLVELPQPGIIVSPIRDMAGDAHFAEVLLDGAELPADALLGTEGEGWAQAMTELSLERSGPERFLSSLPLLQRFIEDESSASQAGLQLVGRAFAELATLREMSIGVTRALAEGRNPSVEAAIVKDLGAGFEQGLVAKIADAFGWDGGRGDQPGGMPALLEELSLIAPSFSLRGGTREILRGIIARELTR